MTHNELLTRGKHWLQHSMRCGIVCIEPNTAHNYEIPDIIGWVSGARFSIVIECKTSISDFYADKKKTSRIIPGLGMGNYRYFLCPKGLINPDRNTIPKNWGLLWAYPAQIRIKKEAVFIPYSKKQTRHELAIFYWKICFPEKEK